MRGFLPAWVYGLSHCQAQLPDDWHFGYIVTLTFRSTALSTKRLIVSVVPRCMQKSMYRIYSSQKRPS